MNMDIKLWKCEYIKEINHVINKRENSQIASEGFCSLAVTCNSMSRRVCLSFTRQTKAVPLSSLTLTSGSVNDISTAMDKTEYIIFYC